MKKILLLSLMFCTAAVFAGAKKDADLKKIADHVKSKGATPWTWLFYGDSITHGARHTYGWRSFVEIFHERIRGEYLIKKDMVINAGSSGYTTKELLAPDYYEWMVKRFQPQVVFLLIGMNDAAAVNDLAGFTSRLDELVQRLQNDGAIVVLQTYNTIEYSEKYRSYITRYKNIGAYNKVIRDTAAKYDLILVDHEAHWKQYAANPDVLHFWLGETIHPGARGHLEMGNTILQTLNLYAPNSSCSNVPAGGQIPVKSNGVIIKSNFSEFEVKDTPVRTKVNGGTWYKLNVPNAYTIVNEGVGGSPCLKVMRDGAPSYAAFRADTSIPEDKDLKVSFKVKVKPNYGVGVTFAKNGVQSGGALFIGGTTVKGYNIKGVWQSSGIAGNFPVNEWVTCEINFINAEKKYNITITTADGKKITGTVKHPFMKDVQINEVRFHNIMPQKNFALIDDFEFSVK